MIYLYTVFQFFVAPSSKKLQLFSDINDKTIYKVIVIMLKFVGPAISKLSNATKTRMLIFSSNFATKAIANFEKKHAKNRIIFWQKQNNRPK